MMKSSTAAPLRSDRHPSDGERGAVLVIAMIMLIMITLFAVSAIRSSNSELQIVGNAQVKKELAAAAQEAIELKISSIVDFNNVIAGVGAASNYSIQGGRYTVNVSAPVCKYEVVSSAGTSMTSTGGGQSSMTYWEVVATVTDTTTGASMVTTQGLRMRMPLNSCPL